MAKAAVEQVFNGTFSEGTSYDETRITIPAAPSLVRQWDLGSGPNDKFVGPAPVVPLRPLEQSTAIAPGQLCVIQWSATQWWVFYVSNDAAAVTRRIGLYYFNPVTNAATWQGFITCTHAVAGNATVRGFRMARTTYSTGTAAASSTAVTGTGTAFSASRLAVGSRIGFGSTNPTAITTWYEISAIGSDTSITLTASAGTVADGPYVIEELRAVYSTTGATNGAIHLTKGLRIENFTGAGTTIGAAVSTDNIRATYCLRDAGTITNTAANGLSIDDQASNTLHDIYVANGTATSLIVFRYNIRAALTVASGAATLTAGTDLTITGTQTVTGNLSATGNGRLGTLNHGAGSGVKSLYLVTASRVIRIAAANVVAASTTFISEQTMVEIPPGGTATYAALGAFAEVEISNSLDRLVISNGVSARHYITQYRTDASQFDHIFLADTRQLDQGSASVNAYPHPNTGQSTAAGATFWAEGGFMFYAKRSTAAANGQIYIWPLGAHWTYVATTLQRVILPSITLGATPSKFYRVMVEHVESLGSQDLGKDTEPMALEYRTSGISDNSGSWTDVPANGDLSGVSAASAIQFAAKFKTIGDLCVPGRLTALALIYETADALPSQYRWNFSDSSATTGTFAWIQTALFGGSPGLHTINIYRADTNALVLTQASSGSANGTFEFWNGASWVTGLSTDTLNTRRRFTPTASLPSGIDLYATLTVA